MGIGLWLVVLKPKRLTLSVKVKRWHGSVGMFSWQPLRQKMFFVPCSLWTLVKIAGFGFVLVFIKTIVRVKSLMLHCGYKAEAADTAEYLLIMNGGG